MKIEYFIGMIRAELLFRGCRTLKDRRSHLRSLKDRLSNMGFSVAQVGPTKFIQRAWLNAVFVSGSEAGVKRILDKAENLIYNPEWELITLEMDILGDNEILPDWEQI
ncbi:MAG: DUF503 family protein [Candidatus Aegiribacteria sp.]|nr:DUF503 family protein [Candidatus Aegiribacteria sp.]